METIRKLRKARAQVVQSHPFFGSLLLKQELVEAPEIPTLATNGKQLFFNPEYVAKQEPEYLRFDVAHEALHPGLGHHVRRQNRDFTQWNEACDYAINGILKQAGFHVPDDALLRDDLCGKNAEEVYRILGDEKGPQQDPQGQDDQDQEQDQDQDQDGDQDGAGGSQDDDQDQDGQDQGDDQGDGDSGDQGDQDGDGDQGEGDGQDDGQDGSQDGQGDGQGQGDSQGQGDGPGQPGGSQGGSGSPTDQIPEDYPERGAVLDAPAATPEEKATEEREWKQAVQQAANFQAANPNAGDLPADLLRELEAYLNPKASWRELLARYMDQFAKSDYTWTRGNRRFLAGGQYLPSLHSEHLGPILVIADASASMPNDALHQTLSELGAIAEDLQPEYIDLLVHDTDVRRNERGEQFIRFEVGDPIEKVQVQAGGGTRFAPVCRWIDDNYLIHEYAVVVWFTDLEAFDWDQCIEPECPVLWVDYGTSHPTPPFGDEVIELED
jgi:predicted metal-dependent peptidase